MIAWSDTAPPGCFEDAALTMQCGRACGVAALCRGQTKKPAERPTQSHDGFNQMVSPTMKPYFDQRNNPPPWQVRRRAGGRTVSRSASGSRLFQCGAGHEAVSHAESLTVVPPRFEAWGRRQQKITHPAELAWSRAAICFCRANSRFVRHFSGRSDGYRSQKEQAAHDSEHGQPRDQKDSRGTLTPPDFMNGGLISGDFVDGHGGRPHRWEAVGRKGRTARYATQFRDVGRFASSTPVTPIGFP